MIKSLVLGLYASGHSLHARTHKLSQVNVKLTATRFLTAKELLFSNGGAKVR